MADPKAATAVKNWNFKEQHVAENLNAGDFISAESILVCAGKPRLEAPNIYKNGVASADLETNIYPMGVLENVMVAQNAALQKLFEIGSSRSYFIPGRIIGSVTIGRIL